MARPDKVAAVADIKERLEEANAALLTEYRGLTVGEIAQLRRQLRENDAEYKVVKNTLTRRAAADAGLDIPDDMLTGPTALTFVAGDPVAVAKVLKKFSDTHPELVVKGGVMDGDVLDADQTRSLADLASREELLAKLAGMIGQLVARPAQLAQANLSKMAQLMAAFQQQREDAGETATPAAETAEEPAAEAGEASGAETAEEPSAETAEEPSAETAEEPSAGSADPPAADESS